MTTKELICMHLTTNGTFYWMNCFFWQLIIHIRHQSLVSHYFTWSVVNKVHPWCHTVSHCWQKVVLHDSLHHWHLPQQKHTSVEGNNGCMITGKEDWSTPCMNLAICSATSYISVLQWLRKSCERLTVTHSNQLASFPGSQRESREMRLAINTRTLNLLITNLSAAPKVSHHHLKYKVRYYYKECN